MTRPARPTRLLVLGHPVEHSLSPVFQQAALDATGIPLRYERLDVAPGRLAETLATLRTERAAGNITIPHKQAVLAVCDAVTPLARRVGAVNTFWTDDAGRLWGDNTDVGGVAAAVRQLLARPRDGLRVLLLGAGGAARAVREAVRDWPEARLVVQARRLSEAAALVAPLGARGAAMAADHTTLAATLAAVDLVVNATPLGLREEDALPIDPALLGPRHALLDLTYRRGGTTPLVAACRARGCAADDGLGMLVEQGALAFERWFGQSAPRPVMMAALGR